MHGLLDSETYLENEGSNATINGYIEIFMINEFEYKIKRSFDYTKDTGYKAIEIPGLRDNDQKRFKGGFMHIPMYAGFDSRTNAS